MTPKTINRDYAVIKRYKDNPNDFQVLEYVDSPFWGKEYIKTLPKDNSFKYEVMKYE